MQCGPPICFYCPYFIGGPTKPGGKARCKVLGEIPDEVYWKARQCSEYNKDETIKAAMIERATQDAIRSMERRL